MDQAFVDGDQFLAEADREVYGGVLSALLGVGQVTKIDHAHSKHLQNVSV